MIAIIKNNLLNNTHIKIISLILGYSLWSFLGQAYVLTQTVEIPICLYNVPETLRIQTFPETITVTLCGKRTELQNCTDLALHINAATFTPGQKVLVLKEEQLLLPKTIKFVDCKPYTVLFKATEKENKEIVV